MVTIKKFDLDLAFDWVSGAPEGRNFAYHRAEPGAVSATELLRRHVLTHYCGGGRRITIRSGSSAPDPIVTDDAEIGNEARGGCESRT